MKVNSDKRADLVFMVNTNFDGITGAANDLNNVYIPNENIIDFVNMVDEAVQANKKVGIGDIFSLIHIKAMMLPYRKTVALFHRIKQALPFYPSWG